MELLMIRNAKVLVCVKLEMLKNVDIFHAREREIKLQSYQNIEFS